MHFLMEDVALHSGIEYQMVYVPLNRHVFLQNLCYLLNGMEFIPEVKAMLKLRLFLVGISFSEVIWKGLGTLVAESVRLFLAGCSVVVW